MPSSISPRNAIFSGDVDALAVDVHLDPAERLQLQAGGGDDDVRLQLLARCQPDARFRERLDAVGHDRRLPLPDRPKQVAAWHQAHPLVPGVVARVEVHIDRISVGKLLDRQPADQPPSALRVALTEL